MRPQVFWESWLSTENGIEENSATNSFGTFSLSGGNEFAEESKNIRFDLIRPIEWTYIEEDTLWNIVFQYLKGLETVSYDFSV